VTRWRRGDIIAGIVAAVVLVWAWPTPSTAWVGMLQAVVTPLADGGPVALPPSASDVLPLVLAAIVAIPGTIRRKAAYAGIAVALTLGAELLVIIVGMQLHPSASAMTVLGSLAQNLVPVGVLIGSLRDAGVIGATPRARKS